MIDNDQTTVTQNYKRLVWNATKSALGDYPGEKNIGNQFRGDMLSDQFINLS